MIWLSIVIILLILAIIMIASFCWSVIKEKSQQLNDANEIIKTQKHFIETACSIAESKIEMSDYWERLFGLANWLHEKGNYISLICYPRGDIDISTTRYETTVTSEMTVSELNELIKNIKDEHDKPAIGE